MKRKHVNEKNKENDKNKLKQKNKKLEKEKNEDITNDSQNTNFHKPKKKFNFRKFKIILILIFIFIIVLAILAGYSISSWQNLARDMIFNSSSTVLDSDGKVIAKIGSSKKTKNIPLSQMPNNLVNAYISI